MRAGAALILVVGLAAGLTACAPAPESPEAEGGKDAVVIGSTDCLVERGPNVDTVSVTGEFGAAPAVEFAAPLSVENTERAVVIEGDGDPVAQGSTVQVHLSLYNATSGAELITTYAEADASPMSVSDDAILSGLVKSLQCTPIGSRIVSVMPPTDLWGENGNADLQVGGTDSVVLVADVLPPLTPADWPTPPTVDFTGATPAVTLPSATPEPALRLAVLDEGDGEVVKDGATVTVHYQGTSWDTGEIFDQSYGGDPASFPTSGVIQGFSVAMVGQKVGSTVIVTIPPKYGYGEAGAGHELSGQTLVFLIEIEGVE